MGMENHLEQGQSNRALSAPGDAAVLFSLDETSSLSCSLPPHTGRLMAEAHSHTQAGASPGRAGEEEGSDHLPGSIGYSCSILHLTSEIYFGGTFTPH